MKSDTIEDTWDGSKGKSIIEFMENHMDKVGGDFINATEVDPLKKMDLMSKVMKWVDSSISVTYLLPEEH
jgi:ribonucleotide reductase alpha subunit